MTERKKYSQKYKDEAVELVLTSGRPIAQVAVDTGIKEGTLGNWVRRYRREHPERFATQEKEPVSWEEHQEALAEVARLKQEIEFLGKVSAFFADECGGSEQSRLSNEMLP